MKYTGHCKECGELREIDSRFPVCKECITTKVNRNDPRNSIETHVQKIIRMVENSHVVESI
jgi:hypothetical protein